ncbi:hypothetical protein CAPTEDRAFT_201687 [Capitella teleta]|uniref:Uncharacterized protein n=1 Tax=Capitella teleta TaxID=283909 RepID=R7TGE5_CAPTE|nr:hypothetical protein CAPTEDRAFT_201687 [Capitella teleta]|eukprot:ELT92843.1 hypothetical protein CAPTEDRAFT_201687 [Capitella teleta]
MGGKGGFTEDEFQLHNALIGAGIDQIKEILNDHPKHIIPNDNGLYPIHLAVQRDRDDVIDLLDLLQESGVDFNSQTVPEGDTALHIALRLTSLDLVEDIIFRLLSGGADPSIRNRKLRSAYDIAVNHGYYTLLDVLSGEVSPGSFKKKRGSPTRNNDSVKGKKTLISVILNGDLQKMKHLAPKVDVNYSNEFGDAAVHYLITQSPPSLSKDEALEILIAAGCTVNKVNHDNETPLHLMVKTLPYPGEMAALVNMIVQNGADISTKDTDGFDAVQLAKMKNYSDVINILELANKGKKEDEGILERGEKERKNEQEGQDDEDEEETEDDEVPTWGQP